MCKTGSKKFSQLLFVWKMSLFCLHFWKIFLLGLFSNLVVFSFKCYSIVFWLALFLFPLFSLWEKCKFKKLFILKWFYRKLAKIAEFMYTFYRSPNVNTYTTIYQKQESNTGTMHLFWALLCFLALTMFQEQLAFLLPQLWEINEFFEEPWLLLLKICRARDLDTKHALCYQSVITLRPSHKTEQIYLCILIHAHTHIYNSIPICMYI